MKFPSVASSLLLPFLVQCNLDAKPAFRTSPVKAPLILFEKNPLPILKGGFHTTSQRTTARKDISRSPRVLQRKSAVKRSAKRWRVECGVSATGKGLLKLCTARIKANGTISMIFLVLLEGGLQGSNNKPKRQYT